MIPPPNEWHDEVDQGPSAADLERFGDPTTTCYECGATLYDEASICQKCGTFQINAFQKRRRSIPSVLAHPWVTGLIVLIMLLGFILWIVF